MPAVIQNYQQRVDPGVALGATVPRPRPLDTSGAEIQARSVSELGRATQSLGMALAERDEEQARAWSSDVLSKARLDWSTELINRQSNAAPGAEGFTPKLLEDYNKYVEETIDKAPTDAAKRFLRTRLGALAENLGEKAMVFEAQARIDYRSDKFNAGIDNTAKLMNTDPAQYKEALAEQLAIIDVSALPPVKKSELRQKAVDRISAAAVWSDIQRNPQLFLDSIGFSVTGKARKSSDDLLGTTGNAAFDALPFERRTQLFDSAVRAKAQLDADADREGTKKVKALADDVMKNIWGLSASGKLNRAAVEQYRPVLSAEQYHSALTALKGGEGGVRSDPGTFRQLMQLQAEGKYDEAQTFAFRAHRNGLLSNEHLASEVNKIHGLQRQGGPKTEYERTRNLVVGSLDPGPFVQDPVGKSRMADALYEFDSWINAGKRTDQEVSDYGKQLVGRYRMVDLSDTIISLPSPRSGAIRRNPGDMKGMQSDLAAAARKADEDFAAKRITEIEYNQEMATLNRWRKAMVKANGQR